MDELSRLHGDLAGLMRRLEAETAKTTPDMAALTLLRLRLSQASRRRVVFVDAAIDRLRRSADVHVVHRLDQLTRAIQNARVASNGHVRQWTPQVIEADWPGYCAASAKLRAAMRDHMRHEAAILTPMLTGPLSPLSPTSSGSAAGRDHPAPR